MLKSFPRCALHIAKGLGQPNRAITQKSRGGKGSKGTSLHPPCTVRSNKIEYGQVKQEGNKGVDVSGLKSSNHRRKHVTETRSVIQAEGTKDSFEKYWPLNAVQKGLANGTLVEGYIHINKARPDVVFVKVSDGSQDIYIEKFRDRNRALQNDVVAVKKGKPRVGAGDSSRGRVVKILKKVYPRICTGFINSEYFEGYFSFIPTDPTLPKLYINKKNMSADLLNEIKLKTVLYVANIGDWPENQAFPDGKLVKSLGNRGEIETETEAILVNNQVSFGDFSPSVVDCLPKQKPWTIPAKELKYRRDFRPSCVFTIDPSTTRDIDDALSCEDLGTGEYRVGVHIADVSYFVKENTPLDKEATQRSTSYYLVQKAIPMLPELLSADLCSLNPDTERLAFSVEWIITENGEILKEWYGRSVIKSCIKLSYDHAQVFIDEPNKNLNLEELPSISKPFRMTDVSVRTRNLHNLASRLRKNRCNTGSLRLDQNKLQFSLDDETGQPNGCYTYELKDSNRMIEEFMLLANMTVARILVEKYPRHTVLRRHEPPMKRKLADLEKICSELEIQLDTSSSGAIQKSLEEYERREDCCPSKMQVLTGICTKSLQLAKYFSTGTLDDVTQYGHYALNVPFYTHFTSPIRRYPDILVHRLLGATLGYCKRPSLTAEQTQNILDHANERKLASKGVQDKSGDIFFAAFLKITGPIAEKAMVAAINTKSISVYFSRFGIVRVIFYKDMTHFAMTTSTEKQEHVNNGNLEDNSHLQKQFKIFQELDCVLRYTADDRVKSRWEATVICPSDGSDSMELAHDYIDKLIKDSSSDQTDPDDSR